MLCVHSTQRVVWRNLMADLDIDNDFQVQVEPWVRAKRFDVVYRLCLAWLTACKDEVKESRSCADDDRNVDARMAQIRDIGVIRSPHDNTNVRVEVSGRLGRGVVAAGRIHAG